MIPRNEITTKYLSTKRLEIERRGSAHFGPNTALNYILGNTSDAIILLIKCRIYRDIICNEIPLEEKYCLHIANI